MQSGIYEKFISLIQELRRPWRQFTPLIAKKNAEGLRRNLGNSVVGESVHEDVQFEMPPLLQKLIVEHAASGLPPAYIVDTGNDEEILPLQS